MARVKHQVGIISLFIVLVVVIAASSYIIKFVSKSVSGFEDAPAGSTSSCVVSGDQGNLQNPPDPNTNYICKTLRDGTTCPEGTFCNGVEDTCTPIAINMYNEDVQGYYT